ncbi:MAG: hypothetical protein CMK59_13305 [Proteobacteria bacterium]|nr:hypothetical protein [Pseudomonadota bacterium]
MNIWIKIIGVLSLLFGFSLFRLLMILPDSHIVGSEHFAKNKAKLRNILEQAENIPVKPGERIGTRMTKGKLIKVQNSADAFLIRDKDNRYFVIFDMGGGHLGRQGYIYSQIPNVDITKASKMPLAESHEFHQLEDHWWSYDSVED